MLKTDILILLIISHLTYCDARSFFDLSCFFQLTWTAQMCSLDAKLQYGQEHLISYLPLSHIAAQMLDIYLPIHKAGTVWFAQPDALKVLALKYFCINHTEQRA